MILLFGPMTDSVIGYPASRLVERGERFLPLDARLHGSAYRLIWGAGGIADGVLRYSGQTVPLAEIRSVYLDSLFAPPEPAVPGVSPAITAVRCSCTRSWNRLL